MGTVALGVHDIKVKVKAIHCFALNRFGCVKVDAITGAVFYSIIYGTISENEENGDNGSS